MSLGTVNIPRSESSAYGSNSDYIVLGISFTYKRNMIGPNMEPYGTQQVRSTGSECSFLTLTMKDSFDRYDLKHEMDEFEKKMLCSHLYQIQFQSQIL